MAQTRPYGSPLTLDDLEFWNKPYQFQEFSKMLYRRQRSGIARRPACEKLTPEGTYKAPGGTILFEYLTVASAAAEDDAAQAGWTDLATASRPGDRG